MKLVFVTQVLDAQDAVLGFVPRWVAGLAKAAEHVRVLALEVGDVSSLPQNVDTRVIGRTGRLRRYWRYRKALREAFADQGYDALLAHMVPRYATLAAGPVRAAGAGLFLWYTHGTVDDRLRKAERLVDAMFTASAESLRLDSPKRVVTGHGIDLEPFDVGPPPSYGPQRLLVVGRLTPKKDPLCAVRALGRLVDAGRDVHLDLVGGGLAAGDAEYVAQVEAEIAATNLSERVLLHGPVAYCRVPELYAAATLCLNPSRTGSVDKVVLEAMAAGRPIVSCNEAFPPVVASLGAAAAGLEFPAGDDAALAQRVGALLDAPAHEREALAARLRRLVAREHEVDALMATLVRAMEARGT